MKYQIWLKRTFRVPSHGLNSTHDLVLNNIGEPWEFENLQEVSRWIENNQPPDYKGELEEHCKPCYMVGTIPLEDELTSKTCKSCRFWKTPFWLQYDVAQFKDSPDLLPHEHFYFGSCLRTDDGGAWYERGQDFSQGSLAIARGPEIAAILDTHPNFGCIQWKKIEIEKLAGYIELNNRYIKLSRIATHDRSFDDVPSTAPFRIVIKSKAGGYDFLYYADENLRDQDYMRLEEALKNIS